MTVRASAEHDAPLAKWPIAWRGRWIWDHAPEASMFWDMKPGKSHFATLRRSFEVAQIPDRQPIRVTCDARYVLYLNGELVGRGPVREEPEHLSWDEYDIAGMLKKGRNVLVAVCRYYGVSGPWWYPADPLGTLGRGSFCLESAPDAAIDIRTDDTWRAIPAPWIPRPGRGMHWFPPEVMDGRRTEHSLHDASVNDDKWPKAVLLSGGTQGTVLDRPPAAPFMSPLRRTIPQMTSIMMKPAKTIESGRRVRVEILDDPSVTWATVKADPNGTRLVSAWDMEKMTLAHVHLTVKGPEGAGGAVIDVVAGEDVDSDGLPEIRPRRFAARYFHGGKAEETVTFFDAVGLRYLGAHYPEGYEVSIEVEEAIYPRPADSGWFKSSNERYDQLWTTGLRTLDVCATDGFLDCPGREQRVWVTEYPEVLVSLIASPDWRIVRRHIEVTARSHSPSGLISGAAACDYSHVGHTMPEYSLHFIRGLVAYWRHTGDEKFIRQHLGFVDKIIERFEQQRGPSGLLEDWPGWVFLDWTQVDRDSITGAHDGLYAAALEDYATLPGASDVSTLIEKSRVGFEALWDNERGMYVDSIGVRGKSRRLSQQTNAAALLAGIVPQQRVAGIIQRMTDPASAGLGKLLETLNSERARRRASSSGPSSTLGFQYSKPQDFDEELDIVEAQVYSARFMHEAFFRHGRRDLILKNFEKWDLQPGWGTFGEFWKVTSGGASRAHAWAASPTYDLTAYILGVRPLEPGYTRTIIDPYLGDLTHAAGRIPTRFGWLEASVRGDSVKFEAPEGMTVEVGGKSFGPGKHEASIQKVGA